MPLASRMRSDLPEGQHAEMDRGMGAHLGRMSGIGTAASSCIFCWAVLLRRG